MKRFKNAILAVLVVLLFVGCAHNEGIRCVTDNDLYGFWGGLWHGLILPLTWIGSLFSENIAIYAVDNNGGWYDFGFVFGVGGIAKLIPGKK